MRGYTIDRKHSLCNLNPNDVAVRAILCCKNPVVKPKFTMFRSECWFLVTWKWMHARVISETDARKGRFGHQCAQPERPFWRMHATDFWERIRARYVANPGCTQPTSWMHATLLIKHFIEFVFVETNEVVRSNLNVILTRQTCGQRPSRVSGSKHRALEFQFSVRIWYVFLISICREESDLCLYMTSVLTKRMQLHKANFRYKNVFGRKIRRKSALRSHMLFASTEVMHRPRSHSSLRFDIKNTYQIRTGK